MSGQSQWVGEPGQPGWLGRLVNPGEQRPATAAFLLGVTAAVAFVGSLASDWMSVTASLPGPRDAESGMIYGANIAATRAGSTMTIATSNNVTSFDMLGLIYGLGGLALLTVAGACLTRPDLALRVRTAVAGLGVGVVAVAVAAVIRLPTLLLSQGLAYAGFGAPTNISRSYQLGLFCAFAVGVLPVVAVWVRSGPAARAARAGSGYPPSGSTPTALVELPPLPAPSASPTGAAPAEVAEPQAWSRYGTRESAAGWSRRDEPAPPYDLTVTPED